MDIRKKIQKILNQTNPMLRTHLDVNDEFLIKLKATDPEVLTDAEHQELEILAGAKRVDRLVDLLKKISKDQFYQFMEVLQQNDQELYVEVKGVYDKQFPGI